MVDLTICGLVASVFFWFFLALVIYLILVDFVLFPVMAGGGNPADLCVLLVVLLVSMVAPFTLVVVTFLVVLAPMVHVVYEIILVLVVVLFFFASLG